MQELLRELGITLPGTTAKDGYVVDIDSSDDFGKVYSTLEKSKAEPISDDFLLTYHNASIIYEYKDYILSLSGDFDQDLYKLVITKGGKSKKIATENEGTEEEEEIDVEETESE